MDQKPYRDRKGEVIPEGSLQEFYKQGKMEFYSSMRYSKLNSNNSANGQKNKAPSSIDGKVDNL